MSGRFQILAGNAKSTPAFGYQQILLMNRDNICPETEFFSQP
jgi:hypothetical protein